MAIVSCASAERAPCDIAPPENRRTIESTGSTSSSGTGSPAGTSSSRSRGSSGVALVDERGEALVQLEPLALDRLDERVRRRHALLQRVDHVGVGRVRLAALAELVEAGVLELGLRALAHRQPVERVPLQPVEPDPADRRGRAAEEPSAQPPVEPDGLEEPRAPIARNVGDARASTSP